MIKYFIIIFIFLTFLEAKKPTLELGIGMASLSYPSYLGSLDQKSLSVPFPYIQYRGKNFQIEKGGVKKKLFDIRGLSMDLSVSGSLPVDSASSKKREGMNDLDLVFEVGPKIKYKIWDNDIYSLYFRLPIRAVISSNLISNIKYQGFLVTPQFRIEQLIGDREITFTSGAVFADSLYHDYFYGVDDKYVTSTRESYIGKKGYGGYRNAIGFEDRCGSWWYGAFLIHYMLQGAVFEDSPLLEQKSSILGGFSFAYIFYSK